MALSSPAHPYGDGRIPRPLPDLVSLALLLAVLAPAGVMFGRLPVWHGFTPPWPAFLAGALCCGLASMQRRAGWWVLATIVIGAGATAIVLYRLVPGPTLALRDAQVRGLLADWISRARAGQAIYDDRAVDAWTASAAWLAGMWASWAALRAGWHWLVIAAAGAGLAATVRVLPHWPPESLALFAFASLLLLARINHRRVSAEAAARGLPRPARNLRAWSSQVMAISGGAAALVGAAWLVPAVHWRAPVVIHTPHSVPRPVGGVAISTTSSPRVLHDFGSVLPFSGQISLGDGLVAGVEAPAPGYLFGMSYDRYQSSGWLSSAAAGPTRDAPVLSLEPPGPPAPELLAVGLSGDSTYQDSQPLDETVHLQQPSSVLLAAGPPVGVSGALPTTRIAHPIQFIPQALRGAPTGEYSALIAAAPLPAGATYTTTGLVSNAVASALRGANGQTPDWVRANYLQLPDTVPARVRDLAARLTAKAPTSYDKAAAILAYLRAMPYDETIPAPPAGQDGVDYLLFTEKRGYCDYFASAMAVMLRSVGVPARIVVGYVMHETNSSGMYQVRDRDAHAWTEVFFPGYGWQRFDPTPGGAATFSPDPAAANAAASITAPATVPTPPPADVQPPLPTAAANGATLVAPVHSEGPDLATVLIWCSLSGFVAMLGLYMWASLRNNPRRAAMAAWGSASLAGRATARGRRPNETVHEYTAALTQTHPRAGALQQVASAYSRARFGPAGVLQPFPRLWRHLATGVAGLATSRYGRVRKRGRRSRPRTRAP